MCPAETAQYGLEIVFNPFVIGCTLYLENIHHQHDRDVPIQRTILKNRSQAKSNDNLGTGHQKQQKKHSTEGNSSRAVSDTLRSNHK